MIRLLSVAFVALGLLNASAHADAPPKIFVASTGSDANDGGRLTPKRSFQAAHDAVSAGGEVVALDTAGYGPLTITKGIEIIAPAGVSAFVTVTGSSPGIMIGATPGDNVTLRNLIIEGASGAGGAGIFATSVGTLVVETTSVQNLFSGIAFNASASGRLIVRNSAIRNTAYGINVEATAKSVKLDALVVDTELIGNGTAFFVTRVGNATGASMRLVATRCIASGNTTVFGAYNSGQIVADGCVITANDTVYTVGSADGTIGTVFSSGNNRISNNGSLGTSPAIAALQ